MQSSVICRDLYAYVAWRLRDLLLNVWLRKQAQEGGLCVFPCESKSLRSFQSTDPCAHIEYDRGL